MGEPNILFGIGKQEPPTQAKERTMKNPLNLIRHAEHGTHLVYFSAAFLGSHAVYEMAAGVLALCLVTSWLLSSIGE